MLLADFLKQGVAALEPLYPTAEARNIVLMLCEELIGTKSYTHIVEPQYEIDKKCVQPLAEALLRLQSGPSSMSPANASSAAAPSGSIRMC